MDFIGISHVKSWMIMPFRCKPRKNPRNEIKKNIDLVAFIIIEKQNACEIEMRRQDFIKKAETNNFNPSLSIFNPFTKKRGQLE